jgi:hypothetical protein
MIFGFFFVRLIPLPEPMHIIENGPADGEYDETAVTHVTKDTQTPLLSPHDDRDDDDDDDDSTSPHALELSSTRSILSSASRHRSRSSASRHVASRVANAVDRLPNIHGMALVFCGDFWILFITLSLRAFLSFVDYSMALFQFFG